MERVRSIFRRDTQRRRAEESAVQPNGINIEHTTHDQSRPVSQDQQQFESQSQSQQPIRPQRADERFGVSRQQQSQLDGTGSGLPTTPAPSSGQLQIQLQNDTESSAVYAYISKLAFE